MELLIKKCVRVNDRLWVKLFFEISGNSANAMEMQSNSSKLHEECAQNETHHTPSLLYSSPH